MELPVSLDLINLEHDKGDTVVLDQALPAAIHVTTFEWSPDGKELAFFTNGDGPVDPILLYGSRAAAALWSERSVQREGHRF